MLSGLNQTLKCLFIASELCSSYYEDEIKLFLLCTLQGRLSMAAKLASSCMCFCVLLLILWGYFLWFQLLVLFEKEHEGGWAERCKGSGKMSKYLCNRIENLLDIFTEWYSWCYVAWTHWFGITQLSTEKFLLATGKHVEKWESLEHGILCPKQYVFIKPLPWKLNDLWTRQRI